MLSENGKGFVMDNAAARDNFVSGLYEQAVAQEKNYILDELVKPPYARMHRDALIHLHDLEGYRFVYNCCTPSLKKILAPDGFVSRQDSAKMAEIFEKIKNLISNSKVPLIKVMEGGCLKKLTLG